MNKVVAETIDTVTTLGIRTNKGIRKATTTVTSPAKGTIIGSNNSVINYVNSLKFKKRRQDINIINNRINKNNISIRRRRRGRGRNNNNKWIYEKNIKETNKLAKSLGFKNEKDFRQFIDTVVPETSKDTRLTRLFNYLSKNPKSIAKAAVAGGTITAMVIYLKKYQRDRTGCFRYIKGYTETTQPMKIMGNFCINDNTIDTNYDYTISEKEHPLYYQKKWDCNDNSLFNDSLDPKTNHILGLGCNGLCNWQNFNVLASNTKDYEPIDPKYHEDKINNYTYKCEHITILRALATNVGTIVDETFSGIMDATNVRKKIIRVFWILALIILLMSFLSSSIIPLINSTDKEKEKEKEEEEEKKSNE